jgi:hypothetical protein
MIKMTAKIVQSIYSLSEQRGHPNMAFARRDRNGLSYDCSYLEAMACAFASLTASRNE